MTAICVVTPPTTTPAANTIAIFVLVMPALLGSSAMLARVATPRVRTRAPLAQGPRSIRVWSTGGASERPPLVQAFARRTLSPRQRLLVEPRSARFVAVRDPFHSSQKAKRPSPGLGDGLWLSFWLLAVRLHHPLSVGTRMPTLIRTRLISSDTRETGTAD